MKFFVTLLAITLLTGCTTSRSSKHYPYPSKQELYEKNRVDPSSYLGRTLREKGYAPK